MQSDLFLVTYNHLATLNSAVTPPPPTPTPTFPSLICLSVHPAIHLSVTILDLQHNILRETAGTWNTIFVSYLHIIFWSSLGLIHG